MNISSEQNSDYMLIVLMTGGLTVCIPAVMFIMGGLLFFNKPLNLCSLLYDFFSFFVLLKLSVRDLILAFT